MIYVRSLLFNVGFYVSLVIHILVAIPTFVLPRRALFMVANSWVHSTNWMLRVSERIGELWAVACLFRSHACHMAVNDGSRASTMASMSLIPSRALLRAVPAR